MGKAKFKVGQLVELGDGSFGKIEGVVTRQEGFTYEVSGQTSKIQETFIVTAYAPVTHRVKAVKEETTPTTEASPS